MTTNKKSTAIKKPLKIPRRRVQIDMDTKHSQVLDSLSDEMNMTHATLLRTAMLLFLSIRNRMQSGDKLAFINTKTGKVTEVELMNVAAFPKEVKP